MVKIALIGAGSVVFAKNVIADLLWHEALADSHLVLVDIDQGRLETARRLADRIQSSFGTGARIEHTMDRRQALAGADFVICTIGVGGFDATRRDHEIPARFGVQQTVADTLGPGGIFRSARSIPVLLGICRDMTELCPEAWLLNYTNPMATHCLAVARATRIKCVGLCHGVRNTARTMRMLVGLVERDPAEIWAHFELPAHSEPRVAQWQEWWELGADPDLTYTCAGINHMAFFLRFESAGRDLCAALREMLNMPHMRRLDPVRFELFERLGYFMTETSGHTAEYVPYFLKDPAETRRMHLEVSSYLDTCRRQDDGCRAMQAALAADDGIVNQPYELSVEYASRIINAIVTGVPYTFNGNVHNNGGKVIPNLPRDCCVEVPCRADGDGIRPVFAEELPPQCAALIRTNVNVQDLTVRAVLEARDDYLRHALMLDPNTASTLTLPRISELADAMLQINHRGCDY